MGGACLFVYSENNDYAIDIHEKFDIILVLLFVGWIFGVLSGIAAIVGQATLFKILMVPQIVHLAGFIMLHVYRLRGAGYFCSGHYNPDNWDDAPLKSKGSFLLGYMITLWVLIGGLCIIITLVYLSRRKNAPQ